MTHKEEIANRIKVMQAYLDGKTVQMRYDGENEWHTDTTPGFCNVAYTGDKIEWRIKPEPFTAVMWANVYGPSNLALHNTEESAMTYRESTGRTIKIKIEEIIE